MHYSPCGSSATTSTLPASRRRKVDLLVRIGVERPRARACSARVAIVIIVSPIRTSPGRFEARLASTDELLVGSSRQPFVDAARVLIEKGHHPATILVMKHLGSNIIALKAPLGKAAKLGVEEGPNGPRLVQYRTGPKTCVASPPIAPSTSGASITWRTPIRIPARQLHNEMTMGWPVPTPTGAGHERRKPVEHLVAVPGHEPWREDAGAPPWEHRPSTLHQYRPPATSKRAASCT
jgi:hypothetical protein